MIINVNQTKANVPKEFEIYYDNALKYLGKQADWSAYSSIMTHLDERLRFKTQRNKKGLMRNRLLSWGFTLTMLIILIATDNVALTFLAALLYIFIFSRIPNRTQSCFLIDRHEERVGGFSRNLKGLLTGYYSLEYESTKLKTYNIAHSHFEHLSIYHRHKQIAQIDKDLHTVNNRDHYTIYLLDEESSYADLLTIFTLYFDNHKYGNQGEAFIGYKKNWKKTWSMTDRFYNKDWVTSHFGQKYSIDNR